MNRKCCAVHFGVLSTFEKLRLMKMKLIRGALWGGSVNYRKLGKFKREWLTKGWVTNWNEYGRLKVTRNSRTLVRWQFWSIKVFSIDWRFCCLTIFEFFLWQGYVHILSYYFRYYVWFDLFSTIIKLLVTEKKKKREKGEERRKFSFCGPEVVSFCERATVFLFLFPWNKCRCVTISFSLFPTHR